MQCFLCKVFSQFCTLYCTNRRRYSKRPKRGGARDNAQIPNLHLQPSVAVATCRKSFFPQFVLLQYKAKPYLGFQNLGCHCKILGCHFDTQKRLRKNTVLVFRNSVYFLCIFTFSYFFLLGGHSMLFGMK